MSEQGKPTAIIHLGDIKHIEPGKTYSVEVEQLAPLYANEIENIIQTFEQATGAKAVVVQGAKVARATEAELAVARVRELHKQVTQDNAACGDIDCCGEYEESEECADCQCEYPCPTIKALDGDDE
jgi:hypothetical protein